MMGDIIASPTVPNEVVDKHELMYVLSFALLLQLLFQIANTRIAQRPMQELAPPPPPQRAAQYGLPIRPD
jgi:hypothetical protein